MNQTNTRTITETRNNEVIFEYFEVTTAGDLNEHLTTILESRGEVSTREMFEDVLGIKYVQA